MERTCTNCGGVYDLAFFRQTGHMHMPRARSMCLGCEQTARDAQKRENRWRTKARDTLNRHADRFIKAGAASTRAEFAERFGWDIDTMAAQAEHAYNANCSNCHKIFVSMGQGLSDITLDILDPEVEPFYTANTRWICSTCNRAKGRTSPRDYAAKQVAWERWRRIQADPPIKTLF